MQPFAEEHTDLVQALFPPRRLAFLPVVLGLGLLSAVLFVVVASTLLQAHRQVAELQQSGRTGHS